MSVSCGAVRATATSQETDIGVAVNYADVTILDRQNNGVSTTVESRATGIDGIQGKNRINIAATTGSVEAGASSTVRSRGAAIGIGGRPQNTDQRVSSG